MLESYGIRELSAQGVMMSTYWKIPGIVLIDETYLQLQISLVFMSPDSKQAEDEKWVY